ncbi:MAG: adenosine deaminase, partial [Actinomycetota bacterium]
MTGMLRPPRWGGLLLPLLAALSLIFLLLLPTASRAGADAAMESSVSRYLDSIRDDPVRMAAFLRDMPKGGDLHSHLSGAVSTESLIRFAVTDGLCIDTASFVASFPPCTSTQRPAADTTTDENFYNQIIAAWSMEDFVQGPESGHDHFFNAFGKFDAASSKKGDMLAEVASRAAAQNQFYLEIMLTRQSSAVRKLAQRFGFDPDLAQMLKRLKEDGAMDKLVEAAKADTDADLTRFSSLLGCGGPEADPACTLPIRFISQVNRTSPPEVVFAQAVLGFELMEKDKRYAGINFVAPEDNRVALADYRLHMQMVGFLRDQY